MDYLFTYSSGTDEIPFTQSLPFHHLCSSGVSSDKLLGYFSNFNVVEFYI